MPDACVRLKRDKEQWTPKKVLVKLVLQGKLTTCHNSTTQLASWLIQQHEGVPTWEF